MSTFPFRAQLSVTHLKSLLILARLCRRGNAFTNFLKLLLACRDDMASVEIHLDSKKQVSPPAPASIEVSNTAEPRPLHTHLHGVCDVNR